MLPCKKKAGSSKGRWDGGCHCDRNGVGFCFSICTEDADTLSFWGSWTFCMSCSEGNARGGCVNTEAFFLSSFVLMLVERQTRWVWGMCIWSSDSRLIIQRVQVKSDVK